MASAIPSISAIPEWVPYVAAVVVIVAAIWGISAYYERKRSEALAAVAPQLGLTFSAKDQMRGLVCKPHCFREATARKSATL